MVHERDHEREQVEEAVGESISNAEHAAAVGGDAASSGSSLDDGAACRRPTFRRQIADCSDGFSVESTTRKGQKRLNSQRNSTAAASPPRRH
eukprot:1040332-Pleurochrysis_carterae.AAC.2